MTPDQFYAQYIPYAQSVSQRTGLDPRLVLAQSALETGYGKSAPGMNFFGIKSHGRKGGNTLGTQEFEGGRMVQQPASFRGYETPEQSFMDYADFLQSNPRYGDVLSARGLEAQIAEMGKSGYATDPDYAAKLTNIAGQFDPNSAPIIGADAMRAIGKEPARRNGGILASQPTEQTETATMTPQEQKPRGLLGSLGIQKMEEGAEGETGQRFYNRDSFKDTAAVLAQGFGRMGIMGMEEIADSVAKQRTENKARNKTAEYLRKAGRGDLADMVDQGMIGGREAASAMMQKPDEKGQVVSAAQLREMYPGSEIADGLYNLKKDNTITKVGGAPQVVVNSGDKGANKFAELDAKTLVDVASTGMQAQRSLGQINRLESLLEGVPTGAQGAIKLLAGNFGIKTEGLDDLQAAQALINSLVPQQRPAGSGPMSDADLELFKQSLPRIINSPNGNQIILETMRGVAQYDKMGADIVQRYRSGEITQSQAFAELGTRPDPFAGLNLGAPAQQGGGMTPEDAAKLLEGL